MGNVKNNIFVKIVLFFVVLASAIPAYLYLCQILPYQEKEFKVNLYDKTKAIADLSKPAIEKALKSKDDISLLSQIESIAKTDGITTAYILNSDGKVIMHEKPTEWGKVYEDSFIKKAINTKEATASKMQGNGGYLFSMPIVSSATLFVLISQQKIDNSMALLRKNAFYTSLSVLAIVTLIFSIFISYFISQRIKLLIDMSRNDIIYRMESEKADINNKIKEAYNNIELILNTITKEINKGIIVLNTENRIIFAKELPEDLLLAPCHNFADKHILDVIREPFLINLLAKSSGKLNAVFEEKQENRTYRIIPIGNKINEFTGTVIFIN